MNQLDDLLDEVRSLFAQGSWPAGRERCLRGARTAIIVGAVDSAVSGVDVPVTVYVGADPAPLEGMPIRIRHHDEAATTKTVTWAGRLNAHGELIFRGLPEDGAYGISLVTTEPRAARARWESDLPLGMSGKAVVGFGQLEFHERYSNADGSVTCDIEISDSGSVDAYTTVLGDGWAGHLVTVTWRFAGADGQSRGAPQSLVIPLRCTAPSEWTGWVTLAERVDAWASGDRLDVEVSSLPWPRAELVEVPIEVIGESASHAGEGTKAVWREMVVSDVPLAVQAEIRRRVG